MRWKQAPTGGLPNVWVHETTAFRTSHSRCKHPAWRGTRRTTSPGDGIAATCAHHDEAAFKTELVCDSVSDRIAVFAPSQGGVGDGARVLEEACRRAPGGGAGQARVGRAERTHRFERVTYNCPPKLDGPVCYTVQPHGVRPVPYDHRPRWLVVLGTSVATGAGAQATP